MYISYISLNEIKSIIFQDPIEKDRFDSSTFHFTIRTNVFSVKIIEINQ